MNASRSFLLLAMAAVTLFSREAHSATYWGGEVPFVTSTVVEASVTEAGGEYTYSYTVKSGTANIGIIETIYLDISLPYVNFPLADTLASSPCYDKNMELSLVVPPPEGKPFVPVVAYCPGDWYPMLGSRQGILIWLSGDTSINPGDVVSGFMVKSPGLPGIRTLTFNPIRVAPGEESGITVEQVRALQEQVAYRVKTIGPAAPPVDSFGSPILFFDTLRGYIAESQTLGWLTDPALAAALTSKLDAAKAEVYSPDRTVDHSGPATALLREFMDLAQNATPSQITLEAKGLLYYNARYALSTLPRRHPGP